MTGDPSHSTRRYDSLALRYGDDWVVQAAIAPTVVAAGRSFIIS
jgi:hypothetical protein